MRKGKKKVRLNRCIILVGNPSNGTFPPLAFFPFFTLFHHPLTITVRRPGIQGRIAGERPGINRPNRRDKHQQHDEHQKEGLSPAAEEGGRGRARVLGEEGSHVCGGGGGGRGSGSNQ